LTTFLLSKETELGRKHLNRRILENLTDFIDNMKILFAGSPQSSAKILNSMANAGFDIVGVISQPDKRSKRGRGKEASSVAAEAFKLGIQTFKPTKLDNLFKQEITQLNFDFLVVSAYGKILPEWMLDAPNIAPINIHFSLLPKYRGASPIQASILNNDNETGISIMRMSKGMDEGPVYCSHEIKILKSDNKIDLENKLVSLCVKNLENDLHNILNNKLALEEQNNDEASYCSKINKLSGKTDFTKESTEEIFQKFKAFFGWPGLYFEKNNMPIKIHGLKEYNGNKEAFKENDFKFMSEGLAVKTIDSMIVITHIQLPGKRVISATDAMNSHAEFFEK
jgi:methionyl-tRNA formyltransferase